MDKELHYRVFAKFILVVAIGLGGAIGYFSGVEVGEANAVQLMQASRDAAYSTVDKKADTTSRGDKLADCYEEKLGATRYAAVMADGGEMTGEEVLSVLPCAAARR